MSSNINWIVEKNYINNFHFSKCSEILHCNLCSADDWYFRYLPISSFLYNKTTLNPFKTNLTNSQTNKLIFLFYSVKISNLFKNRDRAVLVLHLQRAQCSDLVHQIHGICTKNAAFFTLNMEFFHHTFKVKHLYRRFTWFWIGAWLTFAFIPIFWSMKSTFQHNFADLCDTLNTPVQYKIWYSKDSGLLPEFCSWFG